MAPSSWDVIRAWEVAGGRDGAGRCVGLLTAMHPEMSKESAAALAVGRRDALLMELRTALFGDAVDAFAECPQCLERLEYVLPVSELRQGGTAPVEGPIMVEACGFRLQLRLLDSDDLAAAGACYGIEEARRSLLKRSVVGAWRGSQAAEVEELPAVVIERVSEALAEADPLADLNIDLQCAGCGHAWAVAFDIGSLLWTELNALAKRLMREVHTLAQAYGWREADILAMSSTRRQFYLELAG